MCPSSPWNLQMVASTYNPANEMPGAPLSFRISYFKPLAVLLLSPCHIFKTPYQIINEVIFKVPVNFTCNRCKLLAILIAQSKVKVEFQLAPTLNVSLIHLYWEPSRIKCCFILYGNIFFLVSGKWKWMKWKCLTVFYGMHLSLTQTGQKWKLLHFSFRIGKCHSANSFFFKYAYKTDL